MRCFYIILILTITFLPALSQTETAPGITGISDVVYREKTYPNGKPMYQGYFRDDKPVGEMKRFYENGNIQAILQYGEVTENVRAKLFYDNGSLAAEGIYLDMLKDSVWRYYGYYDGVLAMTETYLKGKRYGPMIHYYLNGSILDSVNWENDVKQGTWVAYFPDGKLKQKGSFLNGKLEGDFLVNMEDGSPYITGKYKNDQPDGRWVFYNADGSVITEMNYIEGKNTDEDKTDQKQQEFFKMIEENKGKFDEPDESEFMAP